MVFCNVLSHEPNSVVFYVMLNFSGTVPFYKNVFFWPRLNILIFLPMLGWKYSNVLHNFCHWILNIHILPSTSQQAKTEISYTFVPFSLHMSSSWLERLGVVSWYLRFMITYWRIYTRLLYLLLGHFHGNGQP